MKELLLMRHAKAAASAPGHDDSARPLNERGQRAAAAVAHDLQRRGARPDLVLCSPARRTRETLDQVLATFDPPPPARIEPGLYLAEADALIARFRQIDAGIGCVLLVGHNDGLAQAAVLLAGTGAPSMLASMRARFPTGAVAWLRCAIDDWSQLGPGGCRLTAFIRPRDLGRLP